MSSNRLKLNSDYLFGQLSTAPQGQSGLDPAGCIHSSLSKLGRGSQSRPGQQPIDEGSCWPTVPHLLLPASAATGYSPITHDQGLHPTGACSRKQQARLLQQPAVRHNRPTAQPTSIGTESLRAVGTSTAKVRSYLHQ